MKKLNELFHSAEKHNDKENALLLYKELTGVEATDLQIRKLKKSQDHVLCLDAGDGSFCIVIDNTKYIQNEPLSDTNTVSKAFIYEAFIYYGKFINQYIEENNLNLYGSTKVTIPYPQCYALYNGSESEEKTKTLNITERQLKWTVIAVNVNA